MISPRKNEEIFSVNKNGRKSKLTDYAIEIVNEFETGNYRTLPQLFEMIKEKFGVETSSQSAGKFLKINGIIRRKTGSLPAKADP
jgi:transposase